MQTETSAIVLFHDFNIRREQYPQNMSQEFFNMPICKAGLPTKMAQRGGKPRATVEAESPIKTTNEKINEQGEEDVSCQS